MNFISLLNTANTSLWRIGYNHSVYFLCKLWNKFIAKYGLRHTTKISDYLFFFSAITQSKFSHLILWKQMFKKWMNEWRCFTGNCFYGRKPIKNTFVVPWKLSKVMKFLYMIMDNISENEYRSFINSFLERILFYFV